MGKTGKETPQDTEAKNCYNSLAENK